MKRLEREGEKILERENTTRVKKKSIFFFFLFGGVYSYINKIEYSTHTKKKRCHFRQKSPERGEGCGCEGNEQDLLPSGGER